MSTTGFPPHGRRGPFHAFALGAAVLVVAAACGGNGTGPPNEDPNLNCLPEIQRNKIFDGGVGRDGIPALSNPSTSHSGEVPLSFLTPDTRVFGIQLGGRTIAVPQNILWWHEVANFDLEGRQVAVTLCPLTGSSLAFDRGAVGGDEFVVSGLLYFNNLIMSPRDASNASLWPQMFRAAACGPKAGTSLERVHLVDVRWEVWEEMHPETEVVDARTGFARDYASYPYGSYDDPFNQSTLGFPVEVDQRRPPKERQLGIPAGDGGLALPFGELEERAASTGGVTALHVQVGGEELVVFWSTKGRGALAFRPRASGQSLTFTARDGRIVDEETGSTWRLDGLATGGSLEGERLEPHEESYVAFWFAWAVFQPETGIWEADASQ